MAFFVFRLRHRVEIYSNSGIVMWCYFLLDVRGPLHGPTMLWWSSSSSRTSGALWGLTSSSPSGAQYYFVATGDSDCSLLLQRGRGMRLVSSGAATASLARRFAVPCSHL